MHSLVLPFLLLVAHACNQGHDTQVVKREVEVPSTLANNNNLRLTIYNAQNNDNESVSVMVFVEPGQSDNLTEESRSYVGTFVMLPQSGAANYPFQLDDRASDRIQSKAGGQVSIVMRAIDIDGKSKAFRWTVGDCVLGAN